MRRGGCYCDLPIPPGLVLRQRPAEWRLFLVSDARCFHDGWNPVAWRMAGAGQSFIASGYTEAEVRLVLAALAGGRDG